MSKKFLKIVSISSELDPYSKTGGLADVAKSLPVALNKLGHKIICVTPFYEQIIDKEKYGLKKVLEEIPIRLDNNNTIKVNYWQGELAAGIPVYFLENEKFFSQRKEVYGFDGGNARFMLFDVAVLKLLTILKFKADIIQCHDWHTGLIPYYLRRDFKTSSTLKKAATVFTIHNIAFQMGHNWWEVPAEKRDNGNGKLPFFDDPAIENINFAKRGILNADIINTVSETYAMEILDKIKGQDLHLLLRNRQEILFGIINGIDHDDYNPETDPGLKVNYSYKDVEKKEENKLFVQEKFGLTIEANIPMIVMASRITYQKGFELIIEALEILLRLNIQVIIMGDGEKDYIAKINKLVKKYPQKIVWVGFDENKQYETALYAGGDMFLLPSSFEPCGINQMKALRYGCIPIVRSVGGLKDTISNFDFNNKDGNGFIFNTYSPLSLYGAIIRALEYYKNRKIWLKLAKSGMQLSFSWNLPAKQYEYIFNKALKVRKDSQDDNGGIK